MHAWCNGVSPLSSATLGCKALWSSLSKAMTSLLTQERTISRICSASGGQNGRTNRLTFAGASSPKTTSFRISWELSSKNNRCLNLEAPTRVAKTCFVSIADFPSISSRSRNASVSPDTRKHTSIAALPKPKSRINAPRGFEKCHVKCSWCFYDFSLYDFCDVIFVQRLCQTNMPRNHDRQGALGGSLGCPCDRCIQEVNASTGWQRDMFISIYIYI